MKRCTFIAKHIVLIVLVLNCCTLLIAKCRITHVDLKLSDDQTVCKLLLTCDRPMHLFAAEDKVVDSVYYIPSEWNIEVSNNRFGWRSEKIGFTGYSKYNKIEFGDGGVDSIRLVLYFGPKFEFLVRSKLNIKSNDKIYMRVLVRCFDNKNEDSIINSQYIEIKK